MILYGYEFILMEQFDKCWKQLGLTDTELRQLQLQILENPMAGDVMQGTNGVRKIRFAFPNRGKSGSVRVCYVNFLLDYKIFLLSAYEKSNKSNLSGEEKNNVAKIVVDINKELKG